MLRFGLRQTEWKALNGLLKLSRKDKHRETLHHLLIRDGAVHVTNGRMLIRLDKGKGLEPEPLKLETGVYEILKVDIESKRLPALLSVEKIEGQPPEMDAVINAPVNKDFKPFDLRIEGNAQSLSSAVVRCYRAFKQAFSYEFLGILSPLEGTFKASLLSGTNPALKLESDALTALIMPFTLN